MSQDSALLKAQSLLEINEDLVTAVVENMQLGRLENSMKLYSLLHSNLVSMALELDNYPYGDKDPFATVFNYPDQVMRRDVVDTLQPATASEGGPGAAGAAGGKSKVTAALAPPCQKCAGQKFTAEKCRLELGHVDLSHKFNITEKEEFVRATQVVEVRYREHNKALDKNKLLQQIISNRGMSGYGATAAGGNGSGGGGMGGGMGGGGLLGTGGATGGRSMSEQISKMMSNLGRHQLAGAAAGGAGGSSRRLYRRWTHDERHTVFLGIFIYGARDFTNISNMLVDRTKGMVKSYISKSIPNELLLEIVQGRIPPAPPEFNASNRITKLFSSKYPQVMRASADAGGGPAMPSAAGSSGAPMTAGAATEVMCSVLNVTPTALNKAMQPSGSRRSKGTVEGNHQGGAAAATQETSSLAGDSCNNSESDRPSMKSNWDILMRIAASSSKGAVDLGAASGAAGAGRGAETAQREQDFYAGGRPSPNPSPAPSPVPSPGPRAGPPSPDLQQQQTAGTGGSVRFREQTQVTYYDPQAGTVGGAADQARSPSPAVDTAAATGAGLDAPMSAGFGAGGRITGSGAGLTAEEIQLALQLGQRSAMPAAAAFARATGLPPSAPLPMMSRATGRPIGGVGGLIGGPIGGLAPRGLAPLAGVGNDTVESDSGDSVDHRCSQNSAGGGGSYAREQQQQYRQYQQHLQHGHPSQQEQQEQGQCGEEWRDSFVGAVSAEGEESNWLARCAAEGADQSQLGLPLEPGYSLMQACGASNINSCSAFPLQLQISDGPSQHQHYQQQSQQQYQQQQYDSTLQGQGQQQRQRQEVERIYALAQYPAGQQQQQQYAPVGAAAGAGTAAAREASAPQAAPKPKRKYSKRRSNTRDTVLYSAVVKGLAAGIPGVTGASNGSAVGLGERRGRKERLALSRQERIAQQYGHWGGATAAPISTRQPQHQQHQHHHQQQQLESTSFGEPLFAAVHSDDDPTGVEPVAAGSRFDYLAAAPDCSGRANGGSDNRGGGSVGGAGAGSRSAVSAAPPSAISFLSKHLSADRSMGSNAGLTEGAHGKEKGVDGDTARGRGTRVRKGERAVAAAVQSPGGDCGAQFQQLGNFNSNFGISNMGVSMGGMGMAMGSNSNFDFSRFGTNINSNMAMGVTSPHGDGENGNEVLPFQIKMSDELSFMGGGVSANDAD